LGTVRIDLPLDFQGLLEVAHLVRLRVRVRVRVRERVRPSRCRAPILSCQTEASSAGCVLAAFVACAAASSLPPHSSTNAYSMMDPRVEASAFIGRAHPIPWPCPPPHRTPARFAPACPASPAPPSCCAAPSWPRSLSVVSAATSGCGMIFSVLCRMSSSENSCFCVSERKPSESNDARAFGQEMAAAYPCRQVLHQLLGQLGRSRHYLILWRRRRCHR
jgi:hypothetical protein